MYSNRLFTVTLLVCCALLVMGSTALAASITTDTTDYPRGSTVYITGSGFWAGEQVRLQVVHADGDPLDGEGHDPWYVTADGAGSLSAAWVVPYDDNLGETLLLTADGQSSGLAASVLFTDNVGTNLDQLQNGTLTKTPEWANGNINSQNSCYSEGDGVPFRYFLTGVASGEKYRFTIQSEWTKGGINAYDYFVQYDITEAAALAYVGDVCGTISTAVPSDCSPILNSAAFPNPTVAANYTGTLPTGFFPAGFVLDSPANLKSYGAVVDSMGPYFFTGTSSDLELNLYVYVTITQTGSAGFFWAGHLAHGIPSAWGIGAGAASVSGAPYHMRAIDVKTMVNNVPTGSGAKNQDRSIQNGTICLPPDATITCASSSLSCTNLQSSCSAAAGAGSYEWTVIGGTIDAGQGTNTVTYTATSDTVYIYLIACSAAGACPDDFCCNEDSVWIPVDFDTTPPVITQCPPDVDLGCNPGNIPACDPGAVQASDPCGTPSITCTQIGSDAVNGCVYTRTYRYYVTDPAGNVDSCDQHITWKQDTDAPVLANVPSGGDLGCNPDVLPSCDAGVTASDACDGSVAVTCTPGAVSQNGCYYSQKFTYSATDACGNTVSADVNYTWKVDSDAPVLANLPAGGDLGCNPTPPSCDAGVTASDACDGSVAVTCTPGAVSQNGCYYSQTFTYSAADACGNTTSASVSYTWTSDTENPTFAVCPSDQNLGCNPSVIPPALPGDATATDNCGVPTVTVVEGTPVIDGCHYTRTDTWTATDICGNTATCTRTLMWITDENGPSFTICPDDADLGCNPTVPPARLDEVAASNGCGSVDITLTEGTPQQNGCDWSRTDVWTATDICGNTATCTRTYTWTVDTEAPVFTLCPPNQDLGCNPTVPDADPFEATATDNCGKTGPVVYQGTPTNVGCVWTRIDVFEAVDHCGNLATCSRTFTWTQDTEKPVFTVCPPDQNLGCNPGNIPPALVGDATATDNCGTPTVTLQEGTPSNDGCAYSRTDTWTATDDCGNTETCTRTLTWTVDTEKPVFSVCPPSRDLGCDPASIPPATVTEVTVTDNCSAPSITVAQGSPESDGCVYTRTDVWTATDACGNSATCSRTLTWKIDTAPVASCPNDTMVFLCEVQGSLCLGPFSYTDPDCDEQISESVSLGTLADGVVCFTPDEVGVYVIEYVVQDACGKADTCRTTVYVNQPQITIDTLSTLQNTTVDVCVRVNGMSFPWGGFDFLLTYDPVILSLLEVLPGDFIVDCGWEYFTFRLLPESPAKVRVVAIADMNNSNKHPSCRTPDSGAVIFCLRFRVTNDRTLACQATPIRFWWNDCADNAISDTTGNILYIAGDRPGTVVDAAGNDYTGFLNIGGPEHPCPSDKFVSLPCIEYRIGKVRLICPPEIDDRGDMNLNGLAYEISDAVLYSQYFIAGAGVLTMGNPPGEAQIAASDVNADGNPLTVADLVYLIRIITGDAEPIPDDYIGGSKITPSVGTLTVSTQAQPRSVTVTTSSDEDLGAALFVFDYEQTTVTDVTLLDRAAGMDVAFRAEDGRLNVLVYNITDRARVAAGTGEIFQVHTTGGGSLNLTSVEAASFTGGALDVQFAGKAITPQEFALHQNYPNPFNPATSFAVDFPKASDYTLTIYNIAGQVVRTIRGHASAGTTTISWQGNDNAGQPVASGVYFYRLNAGEFSAIRKMVLMK